MTDLIGVRVSNLVGAALDWAVAKADPKICPVIIGGKVFHDTDWEHIPYSPSTNWSQGGPLVDKHSGSTQHSPGLAEEDCYSGGPAGARVWLYGPTALVAFCRGLVHYKLGDTVQVPKELMP